ncbi:flagellar hook-length control protein FliK [Porticoccus sp. GXU_MW_L64]
MLGEITLTGLTSQGAINSQLHNWRVGQVLEAVVLARPAAERLQLRIGNTQLEARSQAPIQAGDRVLLRVLSAGTTPTLQVVPAAVASGSASELVNQALRQLLPRQLPTEKVLNNLLAILEGRPQAKPESGVQRDRLPARTRGLIETLLARIPSGEKLADHTRLQQLVQDSGLFNEQRQAQRGSEGTQRDVKQALVQLARHLAIQKPASTDGATAVKTATPTGASTATPTGPASPGATPDASSLATGTAQSAEGAKSQAPAQQQLLAAEPARQPHQSLTQPGVQKEGPLNQSASQTQMVSAQDLQRLVEGAIARIVSQQVQSLPQPGQEVARWVFELPYRQGEEFHSLPMVIEREASGGDDAKLQPGWQVELVFELAELGQIRAKVLLRGDKVSASLWAQEDDTAQLAKAELPVLETALVASGLNVGALVCRQGKPADQQVPMNSIDSLLDYRI